MTEAEKALIIAQVHIGVAMAKARGVDCRLVGPIRIDVIRKSDYGHGQ